MRKASWAELVVGLLFLGACGGAGGEGGTPTYSPETVAEGESLFQQTCFTCHGKDGKGLPGLGKDLTTSEFVRSSTDADLLNYVLEGRPADDPLNTTGVAMPPKGGFASLSDSDIQSIIAFIRSIQE